MQINGNTILITGGCGWSPRVQRRLRGVWNEAIVRRDARI